MKCFNHRDADAIAICRFCGKAVCATCCTDTGQGIVCSAACGNEILEINRINENVKKIHAKKLPLLTYVSALMGVLGLYNLYGAVEQYRCFRMLSWSSILMGVFCLGIACCMLLRFRNRKEA